jgi:hypothetical protein
VLSSRKSATAKQILSCLGGAAAAAAAAGAAGAAGGGQDDAPAAGAGAAAGQQQRERQLKAALGDLLDEYEIFRTGPSAASAAEVDVADDGIQYQLL